MILLSTPRIGRWPALGLGAALLVLALVLGLRLLATRTGVREAGELGAAPPAAGGEASAAGPRGSAGAPGSALLLAGGGIVVEASGQGYTVRVQNASRLEVLRKLAEVAGFELVDRARHHPRITLQVEDVPLEEVLSLLLEATPYSVFYQVKHLGRRVEIARVEIEPGSRRAQIAGAGGGDRPSGREREKVRHEKRVKPGREAEEDEHRDDEEAGLTPQERRVAMEARERRERRRRLENLSELESGDPKTRAFAASDLDAGLAEDLERLGQLLLSDPDPIVRAEAALQLGFGDPRDVVPLLTRALEDPAPEVLVSAVDSLAFAGDPSVRARIEPLLDHPSEEVQVAAENALKMLGM